MTVRSRLRQARRTASGLLRHEPDPLTCRAPHTSLRFSPGGLVHACCANDQFPLGRVGEAPLAEIWRGPEIAELRRALDAGDYTLGCLDCGAEHAAGNRLETPAAMYDRYPSGVAAWPLRLEFALSNRCNLECVHCNGDLSSTIRAKREHLPPIPAAYHDDFFDEIGPFLDHARELVFIGGEPFLMPEVRRLWDMLLERARPVEVHVTTNGTVWNERIEHYVHALRMNVAVSIDGATAQTFESIRSGASFEKVIEIRDHFIEATRSYGGAFTINHCILKSNIHELADFLVQADAIDVNVHVIPVFYPPELSLFALPTEELQLIVTAMEAAEPDVKRSLGRNRRSWEVTLRMLRGHLARPNGTGQADTSTEVAVAITPPWARSEVPAGPDPAELSLAEDELRVWSSGGIVELTVVEGVITDASLPPWAAGLGLGDAIGREPDALSDRLPTILGAMTTENVREEDGFAVVRRWFGDTGRPRCVRTVISHAGSDGPSTSRIVVGVDEETAAAIRGRGGLAEPGPLP